jgi:hypothetical protein
MVNGISPLENTQRRYAVISPEDNAAFRPHTSR